MTESEIRSAVATLLAAINAGDGQSVAGEMDRLDAVVRTGRAAGLHPQLLHFLQNRSYAKALQFLGGDTRIPTGACGGRAAGT
jgi:hypothetical protein